MNACGDNGRPLRRKPTDGVDAELSPRRQGSRQTPFQKGSRNYKLAKRIPNAPWKQDSGVLAADANAQSMQTRNWQTLWNDWSIRSLAAILARHFAGRAKAHRNSLEHFADRAYGIYDLTKNQGWVSVGIDHDTAMFAAEAIWRWWKKMGRRYYRQATELLIMADGGGSNGNRCRLWKVALQMLANRIGMSIHVRHFPPGTSKWNKIEHRMFCHITQNWRGRPLVSHEVIVNLIANTTTQQGLRIKAQLDSGTYPTGIKVSDVELSSVNLKPAEFHGEWNYCVHPQQEK